MPPSTACSSSPARIYEPSARPGPRHNTSVLFAPDDGEIVAVYRKIHLFDAVSGTTVYRESDELQAGDEVVTARIVDGGGRRRDARASRSATTCASRSCTAPWRLRGAEVLLVPSAFTHVTGAAHWEVLLRARAIENGCFVVAPNQTGFHLPDRSATGTA